VKAYGILGLLALMALIVALPLYAANESRRMAAAADVLQTRFISDAATLYINNCSLCHGPDGSGVQAMPSLSDPALADADHGALYGTIAHSPHGSAMSSWHVSDGGTLSSYQVESLVTLIKSSAWPEVETLAAKVGLDAMPTPAPVDLAAIEPSERDDPHECQSCHEEPDIHADRFGLNCARCHTLQAWKPALLNKHVFRLDHGGEGQIACQTCHTVSYSENTCFDCHDHDLGEMQDIHAEQGILELEPCVECHPTGAAGEATSLQADLRVPAADGAASGLHGN